MPRVQIYFQDKDIEAYEHLCKQLNKSAYLVDLVRKDMTNEELTKEKIIELIKQYSGNDNVFDFDVRESVGNLENLF